MSADETTDELEQAAEVEESRIAAVEAGELAMSALSNAEFAIYDECSIDPEEYKAMLYKRCAGPTSNEELLIEAMHRRKRERQRRRRHASRRATEQEMQRAELAYVNAVSGRSSSTHWNLRWWRP